MGCIQSSPASADKQAPDTPAKNVHPEHSSREVNGVQTKVPPIKAVEHEQPVEQCLAAVDEPSSPLMVVWKEVEVPLPSDEQNRWDQLVGYNILDTEPEEAYDRITELCKRLFKVPIAMVTFVDKDRVWLKSVQGLPGLKQVERRQSLCAWTLLSRFPEALVVPDLREDIRFKDFPVVVGWPHARFYAAVPLVNSDNVRLGTLCILDLKPRDFSSDSCTLLAQLASMVMREVERKRAMNDVLCNTAVRHESGDSITHDRQGLMLCDMATAKWAIYLVNEAWHRTTGISHEMAAGGHFWDLFEPPAPAQVQAYRLAVEQRRNFELRIPCNVGGGAGGSSIGRTNPQLEPLLIQQASSTAGSVAGGNGLNHSGALLQPQPVQSTWSGSLPGVNSFSGACHSQSIQQQQQQQDASGGSGGSSTAAAAGAGAGTPSAAGGKAIGFVSAFSGHEASRRRSIGGSMRYVRFQFRSISSAASHMTPAVSIPPALLSQDTRSNFYWATVDIPSAASTHGGDEAGSSFISGSNLYFTGGPGGVFGGTDNAWAGSVHASDSAAPSTHSSGPHTATGPGSDSSSMQQQMGGMKTTFSLMPEDNPFQDITIGSLLGWGSYGRVHRGYWNGSLVAVKVLEQVAGDFNPRTSLEPLLHHRLSHPNIVAMFDVCTQEVDVCEDGRPLQEVWMVLEFCNRGTLSDAIQRGWLLSVRDGAPQPGQLDLLRALATAREVARAMEYLHSQSVLHGDLNGNNILLAGAALAPDGVDRRGFTAKVADFGLSRIITPENEKIITRTHGTITHMAPEVITEATHSKAADVYSFGVVLFELLSGSKPYQGMHYAQIRRLLQESDNTYGASTNARVISPPLLPSHTVVHSFTPETAEAIAHSDSSGVHRMVAPPNRRNYATVEADPSTSNPFRRESIVRTRARSYIDNDPHNRNVDNVNPLRRRTWDYAKAPDSSTDGDFKYVAITQTELPVVAVGGISFAQTFEGATAVASSDSIAMSKGGKLGTPASTTIAAGSAVTWVGALVAANPYSKTSTAVSTAQRLGSLAASGVADGGITLAQAESASSMAQAEASGWDALGQPHSAESASSMAQAEALGWDELGDADECPQQLLAALLPLCHSSATLYAG
ncbi:hypothetical protein OEZ86_009290 [Tetradesmus obliquus]|nr:hypothetical protein OEZ86_009290 [Tetradesmus obliquus]